MKKWLSVKWAGGILLAALGLVMIFHLLVVMQIVPPDFIWGGRATNLPISLTVLELIALLSSALFAFVIAAKMRLIKTGSPKLIGVAMWLIFAFLLVNTLGNLASSVTAEKMIFTPITIILAVCAWRLAMEK